jgi:hypothetical protein
MIRGLQRSVQPQSNIERTTNSVAVKMIIRKLQKSAGPNPLRISYWRRIESMHLAAKYSGHNLRREIRA